LYGLGADVGSPPDVRPALFAKESESEKLGLYSDLIPIFGVLGGLN
jgi:hypothetical protein